MNKYLVIDIILLAFIMLMIICFVRLDKQNKARNYSTLVEYTIKEGDNLHTIANNNDYVIQVIYENNKDYFDGIHHSVDNLNPGDSIKVPVYGD